MISPVYFGLGTNMTRAFSALHFVKCINLSNVLTAGFVEYTKWDSSMVILKVVGTRRFPNTILALNKTTIFKTHFYAIYVCIIIYLVYDRYITKKDYCSPKIAFREKL